MWKYNISANLVRAIVKLCDKATSSDQMNGSTEEWFRTKVRERQEYLLSPTLCSIFFIVIMSYALEEYNGKISIGSRISNNLKFADALALEI